MRKRRSRAGGSELVARSLLANPGLRVVLTTMLLFGLATVGIEVAIPTQSKSLGLPSSAGVLLGLWSLGSMTGGILYGASTGMARLPSGTRS
jgi:hypothetical protein